MANRILRARVPETIKVLAHGAWIADGKPKIVEQPNSITWYEDSQSDRFDSLHQLFVDQNIPFDCSYLADGETDRRWFCYRPGTATGCFIHGISEDPDPECKPLAEC